MPQVRSQSGWRADSSMLTPPGPDLQARHWALGQLWAAPKPSWRGMGLPMK